MKRTMIALTALAILSSFNTSAEDQSHAFNDAVSTLHNLQQQEKSSLAQFNDTVSLDGSGRFNADGSLNSALAIESDRITAARRAAQKEVNGTTYRNQVQQQQAVAAVSNQIRQQNRVSQVGIKTPVQSVPSVIMDKPVVTTKVAFATSKGNAGGQSGHASHGGADNHGSDNAHSSAFGGHGYGHDNSRSEGFGGHSHFH